MYTESVPYGTPKRVARGYIRFTFAENKIRPAVAESSEQKPTTNRMIGEIISNSDNQ
jgi:hypothetical protein